MKNTLLLSLALLLNISLIGQTKIDQFVSINIPGSLIKLDTLIDNIPFLQYYSHNESETYLVLRIEMDSKENGLNNLPSDLIGLKKVYQDFTQGQIKSMTDAGFTFESSTEFKIGNYISYKISFNNLENGTQNAESNVLLLNEHAYVSTYINKINFNTNNKDSFLNSLTINNNPKQMIEKSAAFKSGFILGKLLFYGVFILGIILVIRIFKKK
jgi:hypothetical protein